MSYYLFDNPKMGILIALMLEFLLVMAWLILQERIKKPLLLIGPGLIGLFVLLDMLVQTDRKRWRRRRGRLCKRQKKRMQKVSTPSSVILIGAWNVRRGWKVS